MKAVLGPAPYMDFMESTFSSSKRQRLTEESGTRLDIAPLQTLGLTTSSSENLGPLIMGPSSPRGPPRSSNGSKRKKSQLLPVPQPAQSANAQNDSTVVPLDLAVPALNQPQGKIVNLVALAAAQAALRYRNSVQPNGYVKYLPANNDADHSPPPSASPSTPTSGSPSSAAHPLPGRASIAASPTSPTAFSPVSLTSFSLSGSGKDTDDCSPSNYTRASVQEGFALVSPSSPTSVWVAPSPSPPLRHNPASPKSSSPKSSSYTKSSLSQPRKSASPKSTSPMSSWPPPLLRPLPPVPLFKALSGGSGGGGQDSAPPSSLRAHDIVLSPAGLVYLRPRTIASSPPPPPSETASSSVSTPAPASLFPPFLPSDKCSLEQSLRKRADAAEAAAERIAITCRQVKRELRETRQSLDNAVLRSTRFPVEGRKAALLAYLNLLTASASPAAPSPNDTSALLRDRELDTSRKVLVMLESWGLLTSLRPTSTPSHIPSPFLHRSLNLIALDLFHRIPHASCILPPKTTDLDSTRLKDYKAVGKLLLHCIIHKEPLPAEYGLVLQYACGRHEDWFNDGAEHALRVLFQYDPDSARELRRRMPIRPKSRNGSLAGAGGWTVETSDAETDDKEVIFHSVLIQAKSQLVDERKEGLDAVRAGFQNSEIDLSTHLALVTAQELAELFCATSFSIQGFVQPKSWNG
mmetsp:Transcript_20948/g.34547  ORF Transcript_20948/g.34547 Transcript_20948/m.34547 type:complete len:692 (+) Transcript_20948:385-2460(+)